MATKKYDVAVKTGEYTDRENKVKAKWTNVGVVQGGRDNSTIILSFFSPKDREESQAPKPNPRRTDFDTEIGF